MTLKEASELLKEFDKKFWVIPGDNEIKTRHMTLHMAKLLGKMGEVAERNEHRQNPDLTRLKKEVIPDLFIYALRLARLYEIDLEKAYLERQEENKKRVKGWKK